MACEPITPAQFREKKQQFSDVGDVDVQNYIDLAQIWCGGNWPESLCQSAQVAVVCHLMTLDGIGTDRESREFRSGRGEFQTVKTGSVTLTRFRSVAEGAGLSTSSWFEQTVCGRHFLAMMRTVLSGPVYVGGSSSSAVSAYAKDGWWSC